MTDNDGRNASDGRVYTSFGSSGSIYEVAAQHGITVNGSDAPGGINDGLGLGSHGRNHEPVRAPSGPVDLGGGIQAEREGFRVTGGALRPGDVITMPDGFQLSYEDAVAHGLIKAGANGGPRPASQAELDQAAGPKDDDQLPPPATRESDGLGVEAFDVVTKAIATDESAFLHASSDVINSEDGTMTPEATEELAARLGVSGPEAQRQVSVAVAGYTRDAHQALHASTGLHVDLIQEALQDAYVSRPSETREAMQRHVSEGSPAVYEAFVVDYVASLGDTAPQRLIGRQIGDVVPYRGEKEVMVNANGVEMSWEAYIRQGFHKPRSGGGRRR